MPGNYSCDQVIIAVTSQTCYNYATFAVTRGDSFTYVQFAFDAFLVKSCWSCEIKLQRDRSTSRHLYLAAFFT